MTEDENVGDHKGRLHGRDIEDGGFRSGRPVETNSRGAMIRTGSHGRDDSDRTDPPLALAWRERVVHLEWTFFTLIMATGGIANVLSAGRATNKSQTNHLTN